MKRAGATLVELEIADIGDAHEIIGMQPENFYPVSLIPLSSRTRILKVPCCCVSIPSGFSAIVTRFGQDVDGDDERDKTWSPGLHCLAPWNRVSRLVARQLMIFDAPVKDCKTKDHVSVSVDLLVTFDITDARNFSYHLGPANLDSLLRASQEEVMRNMVGDIEVENIFDLFGDSSTQRWVDKMNEKLDEYGVCVRTFTIKQVSIPDSMMVSFEQTTLYESRTIEMEALQTSGLQQMENAESMQQLNEECDNMKMATEEEQVTTKARLTKEVREVEAQTDKAVELAKAKRQADVTDMDVQSQLDSAKVRAETMLLKAKHHAQLNMEVEKLEAEADAYTKKRMANARMEVAGKVAEGKLKLVEAEGSAVEAFAARRELEEEMARLTILENTANNPRLNIVTSKENETGLAPNNSLLTQIANQSMEALRMKLAEVTAISAKKLDLGTVHAGGLVRPAPQQEKMR